MTKITLEKSGLFSVDISESASAAMEKLKHASYDAIVSDYQMPDMDGIEFLKKLRDSGNNIPFIIFTGKGREEVVIRAFENGANTYVQRGGDSNAQYAELKQKILSAVKAYRDEKALKESRERLRALIEKSSDLIRILDRDGKIIFDTAASEQVLGYPPGYTLGRSPLEFIHPEDVEYVRRELFTVYEHTNTGVPARFRIRRSDGTYTWVESVGQNYIGVPGLDGVVINTRFIDDRVAAEQALRASEERYRTFVENASEGVVVVQDGLVEYANPAALGLVHVTLPNIHGHPISEFIHHDDQSMVNERYRKRILGEPVPHTYDLRLIGKDTSEIWVQLSAVRITWKGRPATLNFLSDITRRKAVEQELTKERQRLFDVLETLPVMICLLTPDYHVPFANRAFREKFGEPQGRHCYEFCYVQNEPCSFCQTYNVFKTGKPHNWEVRLEDGTYIHAYDFPFTDTDGSPLILEMDIDMTEQKLIEAEIQSLNQVLEQRVDERTAQLTALLKERELLLREVHHRVKNNLQIIISLLNLQSRYLTDEKTLTAIHESQNRIRAMALVHERMYRSEEISHIAFKDYVKYLISHLFGFYGVETRRVSYTVSMEGLPIGIDTAIPLGLIMTELVSNSLKYAFPGSKKGTISLEGSALDDHTYRFIVKDNGVGIPEEIDWRNPDSLGLRLVNSLVTQLNGTIELDRTDGTTFTMMVHSKERNGKGG